jgi:thiamine-monophosphate kinase
VAEPQEHPADAPIGAMGARPEPGGPTTEQSDHGSTAPDPPARVPGRLLPAFSEASQTAQPTPETLADLGEWELIRRLGAFAPPGQFADDAALLPVGENGDLVVNTDVLVEGLHFSEATTEPADVGWRAAAANLSDLAAMGCTKVVGLTVGLVAPASTPWCWVEGVYGGLRQALDTYGGVLLGGDCSGGAQRLLAITAIGRLGGAPTATGQPGASPRSRPIRRGDGRPGDWLVCSGPHGLSRLGLALLQGEFPGESAASVAPAQGAASAGALGSTPVPSPAIPCASPGAPQGALLDPGLRERAIAAHRRPRPRFDAVRALIACQPGGLDWRVGGCDSSDGLAAAAAAIAASSGCGARLVRTALPLDPSMAALPQAEAWCLGGGEDFELVLALEPVWAVALIAALPGMTRIGELVTGEAGALGWIDGAPWSTGDGGSATSSGYSHFS